MLKYIARPEFGNPRRHWLEQKAYTATAIHHYAKELRCGVEKYRMCQTEVIALEFHNAVAQVDCIADRATG